MQFTGFGRLAVTLGAFLGFILPLACFAGNSALVIVDMQAYFSRIGKFENLPGNKQVLAEVLQRQVELIRLAKASGRLIVIVEWEKCGPTCAVLTREIGDYPNTKTFSKSADGMFAADNVSAREIDQFLQERNVTDLVVAGANGGGCVKCSIEGALDLGYRVWTDDGAIADFNHITFVRPYRYDEGTLKLQNNLLIENFSQRSGIGSFDECNVRLGEDAGRP